MSAKTLLRGGTVLTLGARTPNHVEADVLIADGRIAEVGRGLRARDAEVVDARDTIVMPGFVDTHRHAWRALLRNLGGGDPGLDGASSVETYRLRHGPDDVYAATLLSLLSAVETGITTVVDWSDVPPGPRHTEAALQAHADAGVRTVFVHAAIERAEDAADRDRALRQLVADRAPDPKGLTTIAAGVPEPSLSDLASVTTRWSQARELGLRIHAHVGTDHTGRGVVAGLGFRGLLGPDVTLVHCTHLGDDDLDAIATQRVAVSLAPPSEMARGLGAPPLQGLLDRDVRPGLGVDDERIAPGEMFAQMRAVQSLQHATVFERKLAGKAGLPAMLTTREVIRHATVDGARVAGLAEVTGSLEPGKQADVLVLRTDRPNIFPVNDPIGAVVWGMDPSNVDWVFVAGHPLVRAGVLEADDTRARDLATAARDRVLAEVGRTAGASGGGVR